MRGTIAVALLLTSWAAVACAGDAADAGGAPTAGRRADLATFRERFLAADRSYSAPARAEAEARLARLEADADTVSQVYFELELGRIVALADNGHSNLFAGPRSRHFDRVPLRVVPFGEDVYVLRARAADADLLGGRLLAVDGHGIAELRAVGRSLHGGTAARRDRWLPYFLESPQQMHALGVAARNDAATYRFQLPDGDQVERRVVAEPPGVVHPRANADRWLFPQPLAGEGTSWQPALAVERAPWSLRDPDAPFRFRDAPEIHAVIVDLRQNNDAEGQRIGDFLAEVTSFLRSRHPDNVVLDMRLNGGGDLNTTRAFVEALPSLVPGRVFALTSPWTFSAAISSLGYLEQAAPSRVTIVGEEVGDRLRFFAEGNVIELPSSGLLLLDATERHDYLTGCRGFDDCHRSVVRHPIAVASLAPDIAAPWTLASYLAGRDPAMAAVATALGR